MGWNNPVSISEVVGKLEITPLPEGSTPLEAIVLVKLLNEDGQPTWAIRWTEGVYLVELCGALRGFTLSCEEDLLNAINPRREE